MADELTVTPVAQRHYLTVMGRSVVENRIGSPRWEELNRIEQVMAEMPQQLCPVTHTFTPGLYTRTIFMPAGTLLTSRIHIYEHPFVISKGVARVRDDDGEWQTLSAPHVGVTKPGTRRALHIIEDTVWSTFHVTDETDPEKIGEQVTYPHLSLGHLDSVSRENLEAIKLNQLG